MVSPTEVCLGDVIEILPGEMAPVDGELVAWDEHITSTEGWSTAAAVAFDEWPGGSRRTEVGRTWDNLGPFW